MEDLHNSFSDGGFDLFTIARFLDKIPEESERWDYALRHGVSKPKWGSRVVEIALAHGANPNQTIQMPFERPLLNVAAYMGHVDTVKLLIAAGARLEAESAHGYTAFQEAALFENPQSNSYGAECVMALVKAGCEVEFDGPDFASSPYGRLVRAKAPQIFPEIEAELLRRIAPKEPAPADPAPRKQRRL